jgi:hypothetical protein
MRYWERMGSNYWMKIEDNICLIIVGWYEKKSIPILNLLKFNKMFEIAEKDVPKEVIKKFDKVLQDPFFEIDLERFKEENR